MPIRAHLALAFLAWLPRMPMSVRFFWQPSGWTVRWPNIAKFVHGGTRNVEGRHRFLAIVRFDQHALHRPFCFLTQAFQLGPRPAAQGSLLLHGPAPLPWLPPSSFR